MKYDSKPEEERHVSRWPHHFLQGKEINRSFQLLGTEATTSGEKQPNVTMQDVRGLRDFVS
jgi:hypothetical protein